MSRSPVACSSVGFPACNDGQRSEATGCRSVDSPRRIAGRLEIRLHDDCSSDPTPVLADAPADPWFELKSRIGTRKAGVTDGGRSS